MQRYKKYLKVEKKLSNIVKIHYLCARKTNKILVYGNE